MTNSIKHKSGSINEQRLLRIFTAGNVDDGKSTLIGRLLYDSKSIFEDQYEAIKQSSQQRGEEHVNLALLTDGLRAEREQGITIDVAYRYFSTPNRKFIIADTPGHIQYTRNMVTGSSTADLAIIIIDARNGITEQTRRHSLITSLMGIRHVIVCINKMDLVNYKKEVFERIQEDYKEFSSKLELEGVEFIPIAALTGDNVVNKSTNIPWYNGNSLLHILENVQVTSGENHTGSRFPVQYVIRPQSNNLHDYRGYAGKVTSGLLKKGDTIVALPSGNKSKIKAIDTSEGSIEEAYPGISVTMLLEDHIDINRGDMLVSELGQPKAEQDVELMISWLNEKKLVEGSKYIVKHTTQDVRCTVKNIQYKLNINTLERIEDDKELKMNDVGRISIRTTNPLLFDTYSKNRNTGSIIFIDEATNETVGAGMIVEK